MKDPLKYLREEKETCAGMAVKIARTVTTQNECVEKQEKYFGCCNATSMTSTLAPKIIEIPYTKYTGPHKVCHLCMDGSYPTDASHVIHLLYIGASSCRNYFIAGREGKIPTHLCDPLRFFAKDPCGCRAIKTRSGKQQASPFDTASIALLSIILLALGIIVVRLYKIQQIQKEGATPPPE